MTDQQHPITPPPELRRLWAQQAQRMDPWDSVAWLQHVSTQAARWGADQQLNADCEWLYRRCLISGAEELRAAMRPKPPSLAEQGQRILVENGATLDGRVELDHEDVSIINAALERLQQLEQENND